MNPEMFTFTLVVALIGMLTVFVGLTLLSVMMVILRRLFTTIPAPPPTPVPLQALSRVRTDDRRWVIAAVAAFLALEGNERDRSAASWRPKVFDDQWSVQPRV